MEKVERRGQPVHVVGYIECAVVGDPDNFDQQVSLFWFKPGTSAPEYSDESTLWMDFESTGETTRRNHAHALGTLVLEEFNSYTLKDARRDFVEFLLHDIDPHFYVGDSDYPWRL